MQKDGSDLSTFWLGFGINRKTTKRPVMVTPYGGTFHSCMEYSREWYTEESNARGIEMPDRKVESARVVHLARHVWDAIESSIDLPKQAMSWLMQCSDIMTAANLPLCWTAPSGFPVKQAYPKTRGIRVETKLGDGLRIRQVLTEEIEGTLAPKRQRNGIAPNYVHSCDASALTETVVRCTKLGIRSFAMIHDSYGTHAPRVHEMAAVLRSAFSDLFCPDRLAMFREELQAALTASGSSAVIPKPPKYGKLDVSSVKQSEFFFA
jgi:DNA-directed RNA polymerase